MSTSIENLRRLAERDVKDHTALFDLYVTMGRDIDYLSIKFGIDPDDLFRALGMTPDREKLRYYILLDEPLNNLDMNFAVQIMQILKKLVQEIGKTIVIVLHDINFAASYADEIVAMKDGQLFTQGTTQEMIKKDVLDFDDYDFEFEEWSCHRREYSLLQATRRKGY